MSEPFQTVLCQHCGQAFALTPTYVNFLRRRGRKEIVPVLCPACYARKGPLPKQQGEVKWFNPRKHFGFITTQEGEEVFFHEEHILEATEGLEKGQRVRFHLHYPLKGPAALNIERVEE
jgi:CspA family cold shock protein